MRIDVGLGFRSPVLSFALCLCTLVVAGCMQTTRTPSMQERAWTVGGPVRVAAAPAPVVTEIEADGLPAQLPPMKRAGLLRDDPSEPFSPNYGNTVGKGPRPTVGAGQQDASARPLPHSGGSSLMVR